MARKKKARRKMRTSAATKILRRRAKTEKKPARRATMFNFGYGRVRAARHRNPDGSLGGWVAATASVEVGAYVGPLAQVRRWASVGGSVRLEERTILDDHAQAWEFAVVCGGILDDHAAIRGHASLRANTLRGHAQLHGQMVVGPGSRWVCIGPNRSGYYITAAARADGVPLVTGGCFVGTIHQARQHEAAIRSDNAALLDAIETVVRGWPK